MTKWSEYLTKMELWRSSLKKIEGNFGTGVVAYFLFLRWLMVLNLLIFTIIFMFIILPQLILIEPKDLPCNLNASPVVDPSNETILIHPNTSVQCCREAYLNEIKHNRSDFSILSLVQGTGFMEKTFLFYGMYTNQIYGYNPLENVSNDLEDDQEKFVNASSPMMSALWSFSDIKNVTVNVNITTWREFFNKLDIYYDLPLAYIIVTIVCYLYILVKIVSEKFLP